MSQVFANSRSLAELMADQKQRADAAEIAYKSQFAHAERLALERNKVYQERNCLVAALSKLWISDTPGSCWLAHHPDDPSWDKEWLTIVFFDLPQTGQMCWHIHDLELPAFAHLSWGPNTWDGHTTEQKYARLEKL